MKNYIKPETKIYQVGLTHMLAQSQIPSNGVYDDEEGMELGCRQNSTKDIWNKW